MAPVAGEQCQRTCPHAGPVPASGTGRGPVIGLPRGRVEDGPATGTHAARRCRQRVGHHGIPAHGRVTARASTHTNRHVLVRHRVVAVIHARHRIHSVGVMMRHALSPKSRVIRLIVAVARWRAIPTVMPRKGTINTCFHITYSCVKISPGCGQLRLSWFTRMVEGPATNCLDGHLVGVRDHDGEQDGAPDLWGCDAPDAVRERSPALITVTGVDNIMTPTGFRVGGHGHREGGSRSTGRSTYRLAHLLDR